MKTVAIPLLASVMIVMSGCASHVFDVAEFGGERRISKSDCVNVRISKEDEARVDSRYSHAFGAVSKVGDTLLTGPVWKQVFVGGDDSTASLKIKDASSHCYAGLNVQREEYHVIAELSIGGKAYELKATGARRAALAIPSAMRQAVELAIKDIAAQAKAIIEQHGKTTPSLLLYPKT